MGKFKIGDRVRVLPETNSQFRGRTGIIENEPDTYENQSGFIVKIEGLGFAAKCQIPGKYLEGMPGISSLPVTVEQPAPETNGLSDGSFNHRDYKNFSTLEEYKEATKKNDVKLPPQFFAAVSKIMKKHDFTFGEACELLEKKGYLKWIDKMAVYDLKGDLL